MKKETKLNYFPPQCDALELRLEGVIAASGGSAPQNYNNPFGEEQSW